LEFCLDFLYFNITENADLIKGNPNLHSFPERMKFNGYKKNGLSLELSEDSQSNSLIDEVH
jgi:hypothetical protein